MKTQVNIFIIISALLIAFISCGKNNSTNGNENQSAIISRNGLQISTTNNYYYTGSWSGYLGNRYTQMNISANGDVSITSNGQTVNEKLAADSTQTRYYITETKFDRVIEVQTNGYVLYLYSADGYTYMLSKN